MFGLSCHNAMGMLIVRLSSTDGTGIERVEPITTLMPANLSATVLFDLTKSSIG